MKIQLKLLSDTLPGAGAGEAGGIDHEVVSGPNGFPYIPGRRIKGCLREAALELAEALALAGYETIWNESLLNQLFGRTGQQYAGWLRIANARLVEETELADWLKWLLEQNNFAAEAPAYFGSQAVLNNYTIIRAQTRISRATGGPVVNTLRTGRALRSGLVFTAQVDLIPPPDVVFPDEEQLVARYQTLQLGLALACAAWRRMGLSRNRGLGELEAILLDEADINLTQASLNRLDELLVGQSQEGEGKEEDGQQHTS